MGLPALSYAMGCPLPDISANKPLFQRKDTNKEELS